MEETDIKQGQSDGYLCWSKDRVLWCKEESDRQGWVFPLKSFSTDFFFFISLI